MIVQFEKSKATGEVNAPPSKSYSHRRIICSALSEGISEIRGIRKSNDILATLDCIESIGASYTLNGDAVCIKGIKEYKKEKKVFLCNESGTTLRFFIPIALLMGGVSELHCSKRLIERGISEYEKIFRERNINYTIKDDKIILNGKLTGGEFIIRGDVSSQFISGLMFALPLLKEDSVLKIIPPFESRQYVDMTAQCLHECGIEIGKDGNVIYVNGNRKYVAHNSVTEPDYSNSAYLEAFNCVGGNVLIKGLGESTIQPDAVYKDLFERLKRGKETVDVANCPDLAPILFSVSSLYHGGVFTGTKRLKIKECDRANCMAKELRKFGAEVKVGENRVEINSRNLYKPREILSSHNDHRIFMALSVLSILYGGKIDQAESVKKSYPDYFDDIKSLGVKFSFEEESRT